MNKIYSILFFVYMVLNVFIVLSCAGPLEDNSIKVIDVYTERTFNESIYNDIYKYWLLKQTLFNADIVNNISKIVRKEKIGESSLIDISQEFNDYTYYICNNKEEKFFIKFNDLQSEILINNVNIMLKHHINEKEYNKNKYVYISYYKENDPLTIYSTKVNTIAISGYHRVFISPEDISILDRSLHDDLPITIYYSKEVEYAKSALYDKVYWVLLLYMNKFKLWRNIIDFCLFSEQIDHICSLLQKDKKVVISSGNNLRFEIDGSLIPLLKGNNFYKNVMIISSGLIFLFFCIKNELLYYKNFINLFNILSF